MARRHRRRRTIRIGYVYAREDPNHPSHRGGKLHSGPFSRLEGLPISESLPSTALTLSEMPSVISSIIERKQSERRAAERNRYTPPRPYRAYLAEPYGFSPEAVRRMETEDRRRKGFYKALGPRSVFGNPYYRVGDLRGGTMLFRQHQRLLVCIRRTRRREVLHAMRKTGKGSRSLKRRYNEWSRYSCRG